MHVVHYNSDKYSNISSAVDKSDGLAVLGVLIEVSLYATHELEQVDYFLRTRTILLSVKVGEFNPAYEHFLKFINGIKYKGEYKVKYSSFKALLSSGQSATNNCLVILAGSNI